MSSYQTPTQTRPMPTSEQPKRRLVRPRERWIGGVCSGIGRRYGISPNVVRLIFVLSCLLPGPQFLLYIMAWVIIPNE
jgi:phage shock protein PspC (stress-responsive transcriptional regulator)